jgi:hypothetical protein
MYILPNTKWPQGDNIIFLLWIENWGWCGRENTGSDNDNDLKKKGQKLSLAPIIQLTTLSTHIFFIVNLMKSIFPLICLSLNTTDPGRMGSSITWCNQFVIQKPSMSLVRFHQYCSVLYVYCYQLIYTF